MDVQHEELCQAGLDWMEDKETVQQLAPHLRAAEASKEKIGVA